MKPSSRILDANLTKLLQRAYRPVRPREAFVRDLEQSLAAWLQPAPRTLAPAPRRAARPAPWWIAGGLAAAALLLLLFNWNPNANTTSVEPAPAVASLAELLERGDVALRTGSAAPWRAATAGERKGGLAYATASLELATPATGGVDLRGRDGWRVELDAGARLDLRSSDERVFFELRQGGARFVSPLDAKRFPAPATLSWFDGDFHDALGSAWAAAAGESERTAIEIPAPPGDPQPAAEPEAEAPLPGMGLLRGTLEPEGLGASPYTVTLLREVALPQVAMGEAREFQGAEFLWNGVKPGNYSVYVSVPGHAIWQSERIELAADQETQIEAQPEVGGVIRGFVVDKESGVGVAGALIVSEGDMPAQVVGMTADRLPPECLAFTHTAADGSFELEFMSSGDHHLRAGSPDHAATWVDIETSGERTEGVLFELTDGGVIEGRCEHAGGEPFEGALIIISRFGGGGASGSMSFEQVHTDAAGEYRVEHLASGMYVALFYDVQKPAANYQPKYQPVGVREGEVHRVDFLGNTRGASLSGTIFDRSGLPMPFANIHAWHDTPVGDDWVGETADESGHYEFVGLVPGRHLLYAGEARSTALGAEVELARGDRTVVDIHLAGTSLEVHLVDDASGESVGDIDLWLLSREQNDSSYNWISDVIARVFGDPAGRTEMKYLEPGTYDLLAWPSPGRYGRMLLSDVRIDEGAADHHVELRLLPACAALVSVQDEDGTALPGARLRLFDAHGTLWPQLALPRPDVEGRVSFASLTPGRWRVEFTHEGYAPGVVEFECSALKTASASVTLVRE